MIVRNGLDYGGHKMYLSPYLKKTNLEVYDNNDYLSILVFLINEDSYNAILNLFLDRKTNIFHIKSYDSEMKPKGSIRKKDFDLVKKVIQENIWVIPDLIIKKFKLDELINSDDWSFLSYEYGENVFLFKEIFTLDYKVLIEKLVAVFHFTGILSICHIENIKEIILRDKKNIIGQNYQNSLFEGYINKSKRVDNMVCLELLTDFDLLSRKTSTDFIWTKEGSRIMYELLDFIVSTVNDKPKLYLNEIKKTEGSQKYKVIIPISGIMLESSITLEDIEICSSSKLSEKELKMLQDHFIHKIDAYVIGYFSTDRFSEDLHSYYDRIEILLKFIELLFMDDSVYHIANTTKIFNNIHSNDLPNEIIISRVIYIEKDDDIQSAMIITIDSNISKSIIKISNNEKGLFTYINNNKFEELLFKEDKLSTGLQWLILAKNMRNYNLKILAIINAIEIISSSEKGKSISDDLAAKFKDEWQQEKEKILEYFDCIQNVELRKRTKGAFESSINNQNLRSKFGGLLNRLGIAITEIDEAILNNVIIIRTKISHNNKRKPKYPTYQDLEGFLSFIARVYLIFMVESSNKS